MRKINSKEYELLKSSGSLHDQSYGETGVRDGGSIPYSWTTRSAALDFADDTKVIPTGPTRNRSLDLAG